MNEQILLRIQWDILGNKKEWTSEYTNNIAESDTLGGIKEAQEDILQCSIYTKF